MVRILWLFGSLWLVALLIVLPGSAKAQKATEPGESKETKAKGAEDKTVPYDSKTHGALQVTGDTQDWFSVEKDGKSVLSTPRVLRTTVELSAGKYDVFVNKTKRRAVIQIGKKTILPTGSLMVEGKNSAWFSPYQGEVRCLAANPPVMGATIALFPGTYAVYLRVGGTSPLLTDNAKVEAGKKTVLKE